MAAKDDDEGILSLFLIDDHPVVGLGLSLALQGHSRFRLVGSIANPLLGLRTIETVRPDALIVDLVFDGEAELAFVAECRALLPHALIVVFSSLPRRFYEREVIDMGADAFVGMRICPCWSRRSPKCWTFREMSRARNACLARPVMRL